MPKVNVIVEVKNGFVVGVVADGPVNVYVADYDIEGANTEDLRDFPVAKGQTEKALVDTTPVDRNKGFVKAALKALGIKARG